MRMAWLPTIPSQDTAMREMLSANFGGYCHIFGGKLREEARR
jgi:hypothetical protein